MPSANDNFANAIEVSIATNGGTYTSSSLDTAGNTTESGEPAVSASADVSAWWKYTPTSSGTADFDTQLSTPTSSGTDTMMAIWTGTALNNLVNVASDDDSGGSGTSLIDNLSVTGGTTYWIQVGGFGFATMNLVLRVTGPATSGGGGGATVNAVAATATAAAPAPAVSASSTITGVVATATATAPVPAVSSSSTVTAVRATATAAAPSPVVSGGGNATVIAVRATATAEAIEPEVSGETILSGGGAATATMQAHPPVVSANGNATVAAVTATATMAARIPVVTGGGAATVAAVRATSTAQAIPPTIPNVAVIGTVAIATAQAIAPQVEVIQPTYAFHPPTHEEPMRTKVRPLNYYRLTHARSVVKVNGTYVQIYTPSAELLAGLEEGVDFFRGGYEYVIDRDTADALAADGFPATPI